MIGIEIQSGLPRYTQDLLRVVQSPALQACIQPAVINQVRQTMASEIIRGSGGSFNGRDLQVRESDGAFSQVVLRDAGRRSSQVLRMMITGGTVRIPSARMSTMIIRRDRSFSHGEIRRLIAFTQAQGSRIPGDKQIFVSPRTTNGVFVVVRGSEGTTLFLRTATGRNFGSRAIAFLPSRATYRRRIFLDVALQREAPLVAAIVDDCVARIFGENLDRVYNGTGRFR